jgi:hypothetical protein
MFKKKFKNKKGSAMVFTTILIANALVIVASIVFISAVLQKNTGAMSLTTVAFQNADSGMEYYLYRINKNPPSPNTISGLCGTFSGRKCTNNWSAGGVSFSTTAYFLNDGGGVISNGNTSLEDVSKIRVTGEASRGSSETSRSIEADIFQHP